MDVDLRRDLGALQGDFDVLVVGAGVYGSAIASAAARRGFKVALIDRGDFGGATSHNSLKLVHGGLRYLQHLDLPRIRESVRSQNAWLAMAPHLVRPLRFVIPTYGFGTRGPLALAAAITAFQFIAWDRNRDLVPEARMPRGGLLSRRQLLSLYPMLDQPDVRGGAYWYDAQMLDANRLTFECVTDACRHGAIVVNHMEALSLLRQDGAVTGVLAKCAIEGRELQIRARVTVNAAGPWSEALLRGANVDAGGQPLAWTRNLNVVMRQLLPDAAIGVSSRRASDSAVGSSKRLFFVTPWRDCSIVGTSHEPFNGDPDAVDISEAELQDFVDELAEAMPGMGVRREDVHYVHSGLTPADLDEGGDANRRAHRPALRDHRAQGVPGFITAIGIKYTTAPVIAERVTAILSAVLGRREATAAAPRHAGAGSAQLPGEPPSGDAEVAWARQIYGSRADAVLSALAPDGTAVPRHVFRCRILHGIRHEMALRLTDGVFRCTDLVERGRLTADDLEWCADAFASELGWSDERRSQELARAKDQFARRHVRLRAA